MKNTPPVTPQEFDRIINLCEFNIDFSSFEQNFDDLARLAAKVAGTDISLVNLIDSYTQWTVANYGMDVSQMPRDESVCQYTITRDDHFEVKDLSEDERFKDRPYVKNTPELRYYYGVPLKSGDHNIGALCVLDHDVEPLTPEKSEVLTIIGEEIVNRLKSYKIINSLRSEVGEVRATQRKVAHDIRGPISGIIGLAKIITEQGQENSIDEVLEISTLIQKSGCSVIDLAEEILSNELNAGGKNSPELALKAFKEKLEKLYLPQAKSKEVAFSVKMSHEAEDISFPKKKLMQIAGNLISNAIKFTPAGGQVITTLEIGEEASVKTLKIRVEDSGIGMDNDKIRQILSGKGSSTNGTGGEQGYGFGLALVKHLVEKLEGSFTISSEPGHGAVFEVLLKHADIS